MSKIKSRSSSRVTGPEKVKLFSSRFSAICAKGQIRLYIFVPHLHFEDTEIKGVEKNKNTGIVRWRKNTGESCLRAEANVIDE